MHIESLTVRGFGCLPARKWDLPAGRAALVIAGNEAGKSTLVAALLAGLCGFPSRAPSRDGIKLSEVYRPWDGDSYCIELELQLDGKRLSVVRDFDRTPFTVRDVQTGTDVTSEYDDDLAKSLLGISRDDFQRIAVVSAKQLATFDKTTSLRAKLSALVEGSQDGSGAEPAIDALREVRVTLDGSDILVETAHKRLEQNIGALRDLLRNLDNEIEQAGEQELELASERASSDELRKRVEDLRTQYGSARLWETRDRIKAFEQAQAELDKLRGELSSLESYAAFPLDSAETTRAAAARCGERNRTVKEVEGKLNEALIKRDETRRLVDARKSFATASDNDAAKLIACRNQLEEAESSHRRVVLDAERSLAASGLDGIDPCAEGSHRQAVHSIARRAAVGWAAAVVGGVAVVACAALALAGALHVLPAGIGAVAGAAVAAGGLSARGRAARLARRLEDAFAHLKMADDSVKSSRVRANELLDRFDVRISDNTQAARLLSETSDEVSKYLRDRQILQDLEREAAALTQKAEDRRAELKHDHDLLASVFAQAGIDSHLSLEDSLDEFTNRERLCRRFREVKDTLLPEVEKRASAKGELDQLRTDEAELAKENDSADRPHRTSSDLATELDQMRGELDSRLETVRNLQLQVGQKVDRYRREYASANEQLAELTADRDRIQHFGAATTKAAQVLGEVAHTSYQRWASALNRQASSILSHLNPGYTDLRFDDTLRFTVRSAGSDKVLEQKLIDAHLSTGAKDQIYFAVRLACCLELSGGLESIPIILDDPLMAADDNRFCQGIRYIVEQLPASNQVIILSCHASRHKNLLHEPWFEQNVSVLQL